MNVSIILPCSNFSLAFDRGMLSAVPQQEFSADDARKQFYKVLEAAGRPGSAVTIMIDGRPSVVMLSQEEFEGWQETLDILADQQLLRDIRESLASLQNRPTVALAEIDKLGQHTANVRGRSSRTGRRAVPVSAKGG